MCTQGPVKFDKSGTRVQSEIRVLQYRIADSDSTTNRSLHLELIAFTETSTRSVSLLYYIANESNSTVYPCAFDYVFLMDGCKNYC